MATVTGGEKAAKAGIYRIAIARQGKPNAHYIGQAFNLAERWKQHLRALRSNRHDNVWMQRLFKKNGESSFSCATVLVCQPAKEQLTLYEQIILDFYLSVDNRNVVNIMRECVNSHLGVKRRSETIARISASNFGKRRTAEQNAANSARRMGSVVSAETRAKISKCHKNTPRHANTLAALAASKNAPARIEALRRVLRGRPKVHSEATKKKIASTLTGRKQDRELIEKRIAPLRGRKQTVEEIAKRVASRLANSRAKAGIQI